MFNWQLWVKGIISALISGGVTGISMMALDPAAFNLSNLKKLGALFLVSAIVSVCNYLKQSPIPPTVDEITAMYKPTTPENK